MKGKSMNNCDFVEFAIYATDVHCDNQRRVSKKRSDATEYITIKVRHTVVLEISAVLRIL